MTDDDEIMRRVIRRRLSHEPDLPEDVEFEVLAYTSMLWSGWEGDSAAVLYRILPDGEPRLYVLDGVHVTPGRLMEAIDERLAAYRKAIADTDRFRGIARVALGLQTDDDSPWYCGGCGLSFADSQPVCPACGHHART